MKTNRILFAIGSYLLLASACSYDTLPTYEDVDRLYFDWARPGTTVTELAERDRELITVQLGYDNPQKSDSTVRIKVCMSGHISEQDRPISAEVIKNESSAVYGEDIEILPSFIMAKEVTGVLLVKLKNSTKLTTNTLMARIRLVPNEYFHVDYYEATGFPYVKKNGTEYNIYFDAKTEIPSLWANTSSAPYLNAYFGAYSYRKLQLICEVCNLTRDFFMHDPANENALTVLNSRISTATAMGLISMVNRYLNQYKAEHNGEPLRDENGNEIKMGISSII